MRVEEGPSQAPLLHQKVTPIELILDVMGLTSSDSYELAGNTQGVRL